MNLQERLTQIKLLVLDHDGVLTDNHVYVNERGKEMCRYSRGDGLGIERLKKLGVRVVVLSGEVNPIVAARCQKLGLEYVHGVQSKIEVLRSWSKGWNADPNVATPLRIPFGQMAYVGNDVNDFECLKVVGVPIMVRDAHQRLAIKFDERRELSSPLGFVPATDTIWFTYRKGGEGAVREVCDAIADAIEATHSFRDISARAQEPPIPHSQRAFVNSQDIWPQDFTANIRDYSA